MAILKNFTFVTLTRILLPVRVSCVTWCTLLRGIGCRGRSRSNWPSPCSRFVSHVNLMRDAYIRIPLTVSTIRCLALCGACYWLASTVVDRKQIGMAAAKRRCFMHFPFAFLAFRISEFTRINLHLLRFYIPSKGVDCSCSTVCTCTVVSWPGSVETSVDSISRIGTRRWVSDSNNYLYTNCFTHYTLYLTCSIDYIPFIDIHLRHQYRQRFFSRDVICWFGNQPFCLIVYGNCSLTWIHATSKKRLMLMIVR